MQLECEHKTKAYTAVQAADRLRERPARAPGLLQIVGGISMAVAEECEDELSGIGIDEIQASSDHEINS